MEEIWKDIEGYEGYYQVSNLGNVKSLSRYKQGVKGTYISKDIILKPFKNKGGYCLVKLCNNSIEKSFQVHRLVAIAFLENNENKEQVNHKNGIKEDNTLINLEWNTRSENTSHAINTGLIVMKSGGSHYLYRKNLDDNTKYFGGKFTKGKFGANHPCSKIILDTNTGIFYETIKEAASLLGHSENTVRRKLNGCRKNNTSLIYV